MFKMPAICLSLVLISGCSTIVSDSKYPVSITSTPSEANFILQNKDGIEIHSGKTPETITLNASSGYFKGETYKLILNKNGYDEKTIEIDSSIDGWYWGNIVFGGLIGLLIVDPATGAMFKLPENATTQLNKVVADESNTSLTITTLDTIPEEQQGNLIPIN